MSYTVCREVFLMMKREGSKLVIKSEILNVMDRGFCPVCGLHRDNWSRSKRFRNCSKRCTKIFYEKCVVATSWNDFRYKVFLRDNFTCNICKCINKPKDLIADHINPISIGGAQWDMNNMQTLCCICNKEKTRSDHKNIAKVRRAEKLVFTRKHHKTSLLPLFRDAIKDGDLIG